MAVNGTDFIDNPWDTTFDAYTDLFSNGFYLIPLTFIAIALYLKTRNPMVSFSFIWISGILLASGNMFFNHPEMVLVYTIFTAIGLVGTLISVVFPRQK